MIVENPNSGELLAVANWPTFNPNAAKDSPPEARVDRAASALYEPGSVFKIVTLSAAIDQGLTNPDEVIDCQNGAIYIAGQRIRDHKAYGQLTVTQILQYSSDVGAIKLGLRLGAPKFYDYIRAFGFGQPTGVDLPGESRGKLRRLENWTPVSVGFDFHGPGSWRHAVADDHGGFGHGQWRADRQASRDSRAAPRQSESPSRRNRSRDA